MKFIKNVGRFLKGVNMKAFIYGMFSNWGLVVAANIFGIAFINIIGLDLVKVFHPIVYLVFSILFYFPSPKASDFRLGWLVGFVIGLGFLFKYYYPLFFGA
ncbi:MAG: hypothetical protein KKB79_01535 [Nanoarchaeota archaeon]|nr:hypothetical protein [Nanoarchaeota archaeon]